MWQETGVVVVVGGALVYLARKLFGVGPRARARKPQSFVPLSDLKRRR
jgi:hypothetical protein